MNETINAWRKARARIYRALARNLDARADVLYWLANERKRGKMEEVVRGDPQFATKLQASLNAHDEAEERSRAARIAKMRAAERESRRMNGAA